VNVDAAYSRSARVYDALCRHKDYAAATRALREILQRVVPHAASLLDVACGTGRHLEHLRNHFRVEGLDNSPEMLEIARNRCPGIPFHEGTLVDFRLPDTFDVVTCLFGSIGYALTVEDLQRAVDSMADHLNPAGVLVVEPWLTPERFVSGRLVFDSVDDPDLKVARMYVTRREERISMFESDYLVAATQGISHFKERQALGLFTEDEYRCVFVAAGLDVIETAGDLFGYGLYVCRAPAANG
jgi:dTDP-3-amino-3,4,6-trideoxy-alpha-D-glucopyranose N,N-dimethyltransferase